MTERRNKTGKKILSLAGISLAFVIAITGCKKEEDTMPRVTLSSVVPAHNAALDETATLDLKWSGVAAIKYNVYFGEQPVPTLYKTGVTEQMLSVPVSGGREYFWRIGLIDASGRENLSQIYAFRVKVLLNIDKFTGLFDCDEPKYAHYDVNISKSGKDTLHVDNFWDLKWKLSYVLDEMGKVNIVPATFAPDPSLKVSVTGSGTFDNAKDELKVSYVVLQDASAGSPLAIEIDRNTHTYKKK